MEPKDAQVYVDGYYEGIVDDFDGHFQHLDLSPRPHHVEIRATGYQPLAFDVVIQTHHKTDYSGTLLIDSVESSRSSIRARSNRHQHEL